MYKDLNPSEKFVFEWQYRMAGGFGTTLAHLFCKADSENFAILSIAFPVEAQGMSGYLHDAGWWEHVERKGMEGRMSEEEIAERRKTHISEKPPEWALDLAKSFTLQAFGNFFTLPGWSDKVLPTEDIKAAIDNVSPPSYPEWNN